MSIEYLDILHEDGNPTGRSKPRTEVHRDGDWHPTVHIWVLNDKGELLLQHRGQNQESNPNLWDVSSAGHCSAGDDALSAAVREVSEELGWSIQAKDLKPLGRLKSEWRGGPCVDREFCDIFLYPIAQPYPEFHLQASEVQGVEWVPWQELKRRVEASDDSLVEHDEEYSILFEALASGVAQSLGPT